MRETFASRSVHSARSLPAFAASPCVAHARANALSCRHWSLRAEAADKAWVKRIFVD